MSTRLHRLGSEPPRAPFHSQGLPKPYPNPYPSPWVPALRWGCLWETRDGGMG